MANVSCSWCHKANESTVLWCRNCGHAVGKSRLQCDCRQCDQGKRFAEHKPPKPPRARRAVWQDDER
jgi:hypothetical protein